MKHADSAMNQSSDARKPRHVLMSKRAKKHIRMNRFFAFNQQEKTRSYILQFQRTICCQVQSSRPVGISVGKPPFFSDRKSTLPQFACNHALEWVAGAFDGLDKALFFDTAGNLIPCRIEQLSSHWALHAIIAKQLYRVHDGRKALRKKAFHRRVPNHLQQHESPTPDRWIRRAACYLCGRAWNCCVRRRI